MSSKVQAISSGGYLIDGEYYSFNPYDASLELLYRFQGKLPADLEVIRQKQLTEHEAQQELFRLTGLYGQEALAKLDEINASAEEHMDIRQERIRESAELILEAEEEALRKQTTLLDLDKQLRELNCSNILCSNSRNVIYGAGVLSALLIITYL